MKRCKFFQRRRMESKTETDLIILRVKTRDAIRKIRKEFPIAGDVIILKEQGDNLGRCIQLESRLSRIKGDSKA